MEKGWWVLLQVSLSSYHQHVFFKFSSSTFGTVSPQEFGKVSFIAVWDVLYLIFYRHLVRPALFYRRSVLPIYCKPSGTATQWIQYLLGINFRHSSGWFQIDERLNSFTVLEIFMEIKTLSSFADRNKMIFYFSGHYLKVAIKGNINK